MNNLYLSWKNLLHKPLSTLLSLVLFGLGVGLISLILLLNHQLDRQFVRNMEGIDMVIGAKGSPLQLVLSSIFHLDAPTGNIAIEEARAFLRPEHPLIERSIPLSIGDSYRGFRVIGTNASILEHYGAEVAEGRRWEASMEVTVGALVAERLGLALDDTFRSTHGLDLNEDLLHEDAPPFRVVGILASTGTVIDQLILTAPQSVWDVHGSHNEGQEAADHDHEGHDHADHEYTTGEQPLHERTDQEITAILVKFKFRNARTLNLPRMINENTNLMAANPSYEISKLFDQLGVGEKVLQWLAYIIIGVSFFSIFISQYNSLRERRYELAIMRTLGALPGRLFVLIILEGLILAALGCLVGLILSHGGMELLGRFVPEAERYDFTGRMFLQREWLLLLGSLGIGFLAAVIPALQASNTDISETLAER